MKKILLPMGFILACLVAGFIGSIFTTPAIPEWYAGLTRPSFSPPNWLFAPVWTTLYVLIGIAGYLIFDSKNKVEEKSKKEKGNKWIDKFAIAKKDVMFVFWFQLVLNTTWSVLFFGMRNPLFALFEIVLLWATILVLIITGYRYSKVASFLLIPYLLWVSFASVLSGAIWYLN